MNETEIVRSYYNASVAGEWARIDGRPEFLLTCRMLDRYLKPGDRVLDIGGGPGRYTMHLAERGCDVTLLDLAEENVAFAQAEAARRGLAVSTACGDARNTEAAVRGEFDHVLLMGPMYHLLEERDRERAIHSALGVLKPGGTLHASFINMTAGIIYAMKFDPGLPESETEAEYLSAVVGGSCYAGDAFTRAFFIQQNEVLPFMARFPLEKLHLYGQEGIMSPCESILMGRQPEVISAWLDLSEALLEREELLSWAEHLMYVGRKL